MASRFKPPLVRTPINTRSQQQFPVKRLWLYSFLLSLVWLAGFKFIELHILPAIRLQQRTKDAFSTQSHAEALLREQEGKPQTLNPPPVAAAQQQTVVVAPAVIPPQVKPLAVAKPAPVQAPVQQKAAATSPVVVKKRPVLVQTNRPGFPPQFDPIPIMRHTPSRNPPSFSPVIMQAGQRNTLSKEYAARIASPRGFIILAKSNHHMLDFAINWALHLHLLGIRWYTVMATSVQAYDTLIARGVNAFLSPLSNMQQDQIEWGSPMFNKLSAEHARVLGVLAQYGFTAVYSDTDGVWMRDPSPFLIANTAADVMLSSDSLRPSLHTTDTLLENPDGFAHTNLNIGMMVVRPTPAAISIIFHWYDTLVNHNPHNLLDQVVFARIVREAITFHGLDGQRLPQNTFKGFNRNVSFGVLPITAFSTGHTFFIGQWPRKLHIKPYIMHSTFTFSGHDGKRHRMRDAFMWTVDPPEYFSSPKGYLYFEPDIPLELVKRATPVNPSPPDACQLKKEGTALPMHLMHYQIRQIRSAYQVAQMTGRVLVVPNMICALDRWYGCHSGSIPGAESTMPITCPFDYIFDVVQWNKKLDERVYGPNVEYREASFFENPRFPIEAATFATVGVQGTAACAQNVTGPCKTVPADLDEDALTAELRSLSKYTVLKIYNPVRLFHLYRNAAKREQLIKRFQQLTALWCCVREERPGGVGHIFYDPFFDIDHTDKFGRFFSADAWTPLLGEDRQ